MAQYATENIRTVALVGHGAAGKTTLAEALLVRAKAIQSPGSVERGATVSDFDPLEKTWQHSLRTSVMHLDADGTRVHLIDTPGFPDFMGQAIGAWFTRPENATLILLATSLPQFFTAGFAWPREAIPDAAIAFGRIFPADSAIDGLVRINQLGASIWEVSRDWIGLWCLVLIYFTLAVISALAVKRRQVHGKA